MKKDSAKKEEKFNQIENSNNNKKNNINISFDKGSKSSLFSSAVAENSYVNLNFNGTFNSKPFVIPASIRKHLTYYFFFFFNLIIIFLC